MIKLHLFLRFYVTLLSDRRVNRFASLRNFTPETSSDRTVLNFSGYSDVTG